MPAIAVCGVDEIATGHPCDGTALIAAKGDNRVTIGGQPVALVGDLIAPHTIKAGDACVPHPAATINAGSSKVFVGGIAVARIGDSADAGAIISGSSGVFAGG